MRREKNSEPKPKKAAGSKPKHAPNKFACALCIAAGCVALGTLVLAVIKINEGRQAGNSAQQLLEEYQKAHAAATPSPSATAQVLELATQTPEETETPVPENLEVTDTEADAEAAAQTSDVHTLDDGSIDDVDASADYVQPEAPEEHGEAEAILAKIIESVGEDGVLGVLEIPAIEQELPIISKWSYSLLKISICRYKGPDPNQEGNLVLMGHNYKNGSHFGRLDELEEGDELFLTDNNNNRVRYVVYQMKTIAPDAFSALKTYRGDCGLTLMTCINNGNNRLLIRCERAES